MFVYADAAATTRISRRVRRALNVYHDSGIMYANPSSTHSCGQFARDEVENARMEIAKCINAEPEEIYFTSGGSEADNWAVQMGSQYFRGIAASSIEHHAVLNSVCPYGHGWTVLLNPNEDGVIEPREIEIAPNPCPGFASIMTANNEIGTIQPIRELAYEAHKKGMLFHTDAVQAVGHIPVDVKVLGVDMLSASAHKFHGPKGVGFLYVNSAVSMEPMIYGGYQERGMRAGTENVPGILGMATALKEACENMDENTEKVLAMRKKLEDGILSDIPNVILNGAGAKRLPGIVNVCIDGCDGETLVVLLSERGIMASSGSACMSGDREPSHVLMAIGRTEDQAKSALRLSIDETNTMEEIDYILKTLPKVVSYLRMVTPQK